MSYQVVNDIASTQSDVRTSEPCEQHAVAGSAMTMDPMFPLFIPEMVFCCSVHCVYILPVNDIAPMLGNIASALPNARNPFIQRSCFPSPAPK